MLSDARKGTDLSLTDEIARCTLPTNSEVFSVLQIFKSKLNTSNDLAVHFTEVHLNKVHCSTE